MSNLSNNETLTKIDEKREFWENRNREERIKLEAKRDGYEEAMSDIRGIIICEEEYPLLETKEISDRKKELEKLNKENIIQKLVGTEETLKFYIDLYNKEKAIVDLMAEHLTTPVHSKEWVKKYYENEVNTNE